LDRSLFLLIWLRGRAWVRLWSRNLQTLKGVLLALVGSLMFFPFLAWTVVAPRVQTAAQLDAIRLYGPLALLAYCVLNVVLSSGDRAIYYSPAEVNFLFCGPYRPKQLLLYKVAVGFGAGLITALIMTLAFAHHAARFASAYSGLFLALELLYLFSLTVGLFISTFGALAFTRGRRLVLLSLGALMLAAILPLGREALTLPPGELIDRAVRSPTFSILLWPFRPFVMAFTAERIWPELLGWSALGLAVDLAFLGLVMTLNSQFLEASAAASTRIYDKIRRARQGEAWTGEPASKIPLPMLPWWGGVGPTFWRQLTTATRSPSRLAAMLFFYVIPIGLILLLGQGDPSSPNSIGPLLSVFLGVSFIASSAVGYDFRPDLRRMEDLKTLPIRPTRLVLGQLLTPVLILTIGQWLSLAAVGRFAQPNPVGLAAAAALAVPGNLILVAIENLYFLWFPYRANGINSFDFQAMGRQLLLLIAKMATVGLVASIAAGCGAAVYYLTGKHTPVALVTAWFAAMACGLGLIPLVALAFVRFDVASDHTE
jgi:hypothetical protein